jgi:hypothetical protein
MSNATKLVLASLAALVAATGIAAAGPIIKIPMDTTPTIHPSVEVKNALNDAILGDDGTESTFAPDSSEVLVALECSVSGDDLRFANSGADLLPVGTRIKWKALDASGVIKLTAPLLAGQSFQMADLLDNAADRCSAKVV